VLAWLVRPPTEQITASQDQALAELRAHAASVGVVVDEVRTESAALGQGRTAQLLDPADAARLYQTLHTAVLAVFAVGGASVQLRPHEPPHNRTIQPVGAFIRHKAAFVHVTRPGAPDRAWQSAVDGLAALDWVDANDARLLPMHCFDARSSHDLSDAAGRKAFEAAHRRRDQGAGRRRGGWHWTNGEGHEWAPAKARHALAPLTVAGQPLPQGMHWDTRLGRTREFSNAWEMWETSRVPYINVAPNAHVRAPGARKAWDAFDVPRPSARAPEADRRRAGAAARRRKAKYPAR